MNSSTLNRCTIALTIGTALSLSVGLSKAQGSDTTPTWNLVLSQRVWVATWDQALVDVALTAPPTETDLAQATASQQKNVSRRSIPITALGVRRGAFSATLSRFGTQRFDGNGAYAEEFVRRNETDVSVGYQLVPGVSVALIRKTGSVSSTQTRATTELLGRDSGNKGRATLVGLSASAPVSDQLSIYGNLAYGKGRFTDAIDASVSIGARYSVSEFGLAYRYALPGSAAGFDALSVQAGYRSQAISYAGVEPADFDGFPAKVTISSTGKGRSITDGFIVSVSLIF